MSLIFRRISSKLFIISSAIPVIFDERGYKMIGYFSVGDDFNDFSAFKYGEVAACVTFPRATIKRSTLEISLLLICCPFFCVPSTTRILISSMSLHARAMSSLPPNIISDLILETMSDIPEHYIRIRALRSSTNTRFVTNTILGNRQRVVI